MSVPPAGRLLLEPTLRLNRRRAPGARRGDRLPIHVIRGVPTGENTLDVRGGAPRLRHEVAELVVVFPVLLCRTLDLPWTIN